MLHNQSSRYNLYAWDFVHRDGRFREDYYDEMPLFSKINRYSERTALVLGGICSFLLFYLVLFQTRGLLKKYSRMLMLCCICDTNYWFAESMIQVVSNCTITVISPEDQSK